MLRLRVAATDETKPDFVSRLGCIDGVARLTAQANEAEGGWVVSADLSPKATDLVIHELHKMNVPDHAYVIVREDIVAPTVPAGSTIQPDEGFAWAEVLGQARMNSRPIGRYLMLTAVAGAIAAMGVITDNSILIVGAMAVSPDLLPICATCVALVGRRGKLAVRAFGTLLIGMAIVMAVAAVLALLLTLVGILDGDPEDYLGALGGLVKSDYSTVIIGLAAGVAAILAFETRAAAAVGVAISVTTVPASAYAGVAFGLGDPGASKDALLTLAIYVGLLITSGTVTLWLQRRIGSPNH